MPGINIFKSPYVNSKGLKACEEFKSSFNEVLPHINCQILYHNDDTILYETNYEYYDQKYQELEDWQISWEGIDHIDFESIVKTLDIFTHQEISGESLRRWRDSIFCNCTSGFFFLAHHPKTGTVVFANDDLARFPVYIYHNNGEFFIGREYSLLRLLTKELKPDKILLALYLIFRYAAGHGSPFQEIDTLAGSSIGLFNFKSDKLIILSDTSKRLPLDYYNGDEQDILNILKEVFISAADKCLNDKIGLLGLTGGYDSRSVAASLILTQKPFYCVTRVNIDNTTYRDINSVIKLAKHLSIAHKLISIKQNNESHYRILFLIKRGLNYFAEADLINFLEELYIQYGKDYTYLTGSGGDRVLKPLLLSKNINPNNLMKYILLTQWNIFDINYISHIFNINSKFINDYLFNVFESYPVENWNDKFRYFRLAEPGGRWAFESEDRNRYYYPSETPFYNMDFYRLALSVPESWKKGNSFYWKFIYNLYPQACDVPIATELVRPSFFGYKFIQNILNIAEHSHKLKHLAKKILKADPKQFSSKNFIQQRIKLLEKNYNIKSIVPNYPVDGFLANNDLTLGQLSNLYSVLSMITEQY